MAGWEGAMGKSFPDRNTEHNMVCSHSSRNRLIQLKTCATTIRPQYLLDSRCNPGCRHASLLSASLPTNSWRLLTNTLLVRRRSTHFVTRLHGTSIPVLHYWQEPGMPSSPPQKDLATPSCFGQGGRQKEEVEVITTTNSLSSGGFRCLHIHDTGTAAFRRKHVSTYM